MCNIDKKPIRLIGISLSNLTKFKETQLTIFDNPQKESKSTQVTNTLTNLQVKYGRGIIKTGSQLEAEKRLKTTNFALANFTLTHRRIKVFLDKLLINVYKY